MRMELNLHGEPHALATPDQLRQLLAQAAALPQCELWLTLAVNAEQGPALCMLRNGGNAWLMYVDAAGDASCHSLGDAGEEGVCSYWLANGQVDEYPDAWCISVAQCHAAILAFFVQDGARPGGLAWQAD